MIGFDGFRTMTDAVGGVDVPVAESSARDGYTFTAGTTQHMDGKHCADLRARALPAQRRGYLPR